MCLRRIPHFNAFVHGILYCFIVYTVHVSHDHSLLSCLSVLHHGCLQVVKEVFRRFRGEV